MFTDVIIDLKNEETDNINQLQMALKEFPMQLHCGDVSEIMPKFSPSDRKILIITGHRLNLQTYGQTNWREQCAVLGYGVNYQGEASYIIEDWEALTQHFLDTVYARAFHQPLIIGETDRLQIREMTLQDLDDLYELYDSLKDCKYIEPLYEREQEEEFTRNYINHMYAFFHYGLWLVFRKEDGVLIGRMGIEHREVDGQTQCELGYLVHRNVQRQGYAYEACSFILDYAKEELGLEEIYTCIDKTNAPSVAFAKKLGFVPYANAIIDGDDSGQIFYRKELGL